MPVSISRNFGPLTDLEPVTREDWRRIGLLARERIITRTVAGQSVEGGPFQAYSDGYAKQKAKIGASSTPNLQLSGAMLNAITVEPDEHGVTLSFV